MKYRPANGTEGEIFYDEWCAKCERDKLYRETSDNGCEILLDSMLYQADHESYPEQLTYDENGDPCCTAFIMEGEPIQYRCDKTIDMFGDV